MKKLLFLCILISVCSIGIGFTQVPEETPGPTDYPTPAGDSFIYLTVIDAVSGIFIEGAEIEYLTTGSTIVRVLYTDKNGEVAVTLPNTGIAWVNVHAPGYDSIEDLDRYYYETVELMPQPGFLVHVGMSYGNYDNPFSGFVQYSGDYSGIEDAPFSLGLSQGPFTVTLEVLDTVYAPASVEYTFTGWQVNGEVIDPGITTITLTADGTNPRLYANANYKDLSPTPTPRSTATPVNTGIILGDVNGDSAIDIVDALLTAQTYVGLNPPNFNPEASDVNCDGSLDIIDALLIAQYYVEIITEFC
ncbi:MAG: dockerin type I repeat-containing protein [Spirochaetales bacterium]|nr:dockerin type I repeat-containing protein [Spirochaetales bacterium]